MRYDAFVHLIAQGRLIILNRVPFDILKMDTAFIHTVPGDKPLAAITAMARLLKTIVESVETAVPLKFYENCAALYAKLLLQQPLSVDEVTLLL